MEQLWSKFFQAVWHALWRVVRAGVLGVLVGGVAGEAAGYFLNGGWPPQVFTHVASAAVALLLGYAAAITVTLVEGVRGVAGAVGQIDDVARAGLDGGINVLDAVVDAVDGPNRHGIR